LLDDGDDDQVKRIPGSYPCLDSVSPARKSHYLEL
jgi:hypothetical protein